MNKSRRCLEVPRVLLFRGHTADATHFHLGALDPLAHLLAPWVSLVKEWLSALRCSVCNAEMVLGQHPMNWPLIRTCLLIALLTNTFNLGRMSVEFRGTGSDWTVLILSIVALIATLIGLAAAELVRAKPKSN